MPEEFCCPLSVKNEIFEWTISKKKKIIKKNKPKWTPTKTNIEIEWARGTNKRYIKKYNLKHIYSHTMEHMLMFSFVWVYLVCRFRFPLFNFCRFSSTYYFVDDHRHHHTMQHALTHKHQHQACSLRVNRKWINVLCNKETERQIVRERGGGGSTQ